MSERRELWRATLTQGGEIVAMASGDKASALANILHYAGVYVQDAPVSIKLEQVKP